MRKIFCSSEISGSEKLFRAGPPLIRIKTECQKQFHLPNDFIGLLDSAESFDQSFFENHVVKCYVACIFQTSTPKGASVESFIKVMNVKNRISVQENWGKCMDDAKAHKENCQQNYQVVKCLSEKTILKKVDTQENTTADKSTKVKITNKIDQTTKNYNEEDAKEIKRNDDDDNNNKDNNNNEEDDKNSENHEDDAKNDDQHNVDKNSPKIDQNDDKPEEESSYNNDNLKEDNEKEEEVPKKGQIGEEKIDDQKNKEENARKDQNFTDIQSKQMKEAVEDPKYSRPYNIGNGFVH